MNGSTSDFLKAACVPRAASHSSGTLSEAEAIRTARPDITGANIYTAAVLGNDDQVRHFLTADPANATAPGGPYQWDALTHLCFSRYLRLDPTRSAGFVRAGAALLDAGASAKTGFYEGEHQPSPEFECVLYGAAGIAHHPQLTQLLLDHGADPNDGEVTYHSPENSDNRALHLLVRSGRLTPDSLATMLLRKSDWHDEDGIKFLLEQGADPNHFTPWGLTALHQAIRRDNALSIVRLLLQHGADPRLVVKQPPVSGISLAVQRGRADLLPLFAEAGFPIVLQGLERLVAACVRSDETEIRSITQYEPRLVDELRTSGGKLLAEFAGVGNSKGVEHLLDLGVDVRSLYQGDGYFGIPKDSTALHVAAWRGRPHTVNFLLSRGAPAELPDGAGRTPLQLAVRACVDSYWTERRSPESVQALLAAGCSLKGVKYPCGYAEVDELLKSHGATA